MIPNYLSYYFRKNQQPFDVITNYKQDEAEKILKNDKFWRSDGTYFLHRKKHEKIIRHKFIQKGFSPKREWPIYAILGESPVGPHDLENEYFYKIKIPLEVFSENDISFTYPDSLYEVPRLDLGKLYLERSTYPVVYSFHDLKNVIEEYKVYEYNNHYIEAQIWNEDNIKHLRDKKYWIKCIKRNL